jgi:hypothetical protein
LLTRAALFWLWPPAAPCYSWLLGGTVDFHAPG